MVPSKLPVPGRPTTFECSGARAYCTCSGCGWGFLDIFSLVYHFFFFLPRERSGGAMVLGKLTVPGRPTIWMIVGQGSPALVGGGCLDIFTLIYPFSPGGWSGGAMVLGKFPVPGRPTIWIRATALTVGAGGGCLAVFSLVCHFSFLSPSLWETARYRLNIVSKGR